MNVRTRRSQRGTTLILSLVVLMLITALAGSMVVSIVNGRKLSLLARQNAQAACLADAAVSRAVARLAQSPDYPGETWTVSAEELEGVGHAGVTIQVDPPRDGQPDFRTVRVRAEFFGRALNTLARSSRELYVRVGRSPTGATP